MLALVAAATAAAAAAALGGDALRINGCVIPWRRVESCFA